MTKKKNDLDEVKISESLYWGDETSKAIENFAISNYKLNPIFIKSFAYVKLACVKVNHKLGYIESEISDVIQWACQLIIDGKFHNQIVVDAMQGGAGTSTNMNFNEVIANIALEKLNLPKGSYHKIHPLHHINLHQSTNDVYPTALKIAILFLLKDLEKALSELQTVLQAKEMEFKDIIKLGRTQMQDAVPMTMGMTFGAFSEAIARDRWRIFKSRERIKTVNLGGTAIGTGLNAPRQFIFQAAEQLRRITGLNISRSENLIDSTQNLDSFVEISGMLKATASNLLKISTDLRILSSGPGGGIAEIVLPKRQKGSTIMPGKVNPVIPEMMTQVAIKVMSNDNIIAQVAGLGSMELNPFLPLLGFSLLESLSLLTNSIPKFNKLCICGIKVNINNCLKNVQKSQALSTILVSKLGYSRVEELVMKADLNKKDIKEILIEDKILTTLEIEELFVPANMYKLGFTDERS